MGRKKGSNTKKNCWNVKVIQGETELYNNDYKTLREAGKDLGMSYCQIFELAPNGRSKNKKKHRFAPDIIVSKINNSIKLRKINNSIEIPKINNSIEIPKINNSIEIPKIDEIDENNNTIEI